MKKILVTGATGLVGKYLKEIMPNANYVSSKDYNLLIQNDVKKMFKELKLDATLSIVSENKISELPKNIEFLGHGFDTETLINIYDDHNIMILPSFTEGHPQVVIESLSRRRPVIIFEEISHVVKNRKGIFISKRNKIDFSKTVEHIIKNYKKIQDEMDENKLPTKDEFFFKISEILKVN